MDEQELLARRFEAHRGHLRAVAYRMLGSLSEAEDAIQEAWLRLASADTSDVQNLAGWLTTVVSHVCLDVLRSRKTRLEELASCDVAELSTTGQDETDPEREAVLADSVGRALLVVLDTLGPDERIALVLHDMFAVPFDEIAPIVDRSPVATKKLAGRARQRMKGPATVPRAELKRNRHVVDACLAASRGGDINGFLEVLAPDVVRRADRTAVRSGTATEIHGADAVVEETIVVGRRSQSQRVNGAVGIVVAPHGHLLLALTLTITDGKDRRVRRDR